MNLELNDQQAEFIVENFKAQLNMVEEDKLTLSATSQAIMEQIIDKIEGENFYCKFCGTDKEEDCKCNDSRNQYNGEE